MGRGEAIDLIAQNYQPGEHLIGGSPAAEFVLAVSPLSGAR
jgi:hypothetical protein